MTPPFVGRGTEVTRLRRALQSAAEGRGSVWSLVGPAGIGKTRLMEELARIAGPGGFDVTWGLSTWEGQTPLFPFLQLLRVRSGDLPPSAVVSQGARGDPRPGSRKRSTSPTAKGPPRTPDHLAIQLLDALEESTRATPQLLLIDDFHRSDPDSVRFMKLLARLAPHHRVLVVFSMRGESLSAPSRASPELSDLLEELRIGGLLLTIELAGLSEPEMMLLATSLFRASAPRKRPNVLGLSTLIQTAGGNPFFLRELVSALVEERGVLGRAAPETATASPAESSEGASALPGSISDLLQHRLSALPRPERRVLGVAAVIGESFRSEDVAVALGRGEGPVRRVLSRLGAFGWPIRRGPAATGEFVFQHDLLRQMSLELLSPLDRKRISGRLATLWESLHPDDLESIARLHAGSSSASGGLQAVDRLIEEALISHSYASLDRFLLWKSQIVDPSPESRRAYLSAFFHVLEQLRPNLPQEFGKLCERFLDLHPPEPERSLVEAWYIQGLILEDRPRAVRLLEDLRPGRSSLRAASSSAIVDQRESCEITLELTRGEFEAALPRARRLFRRLDARGPSLDALNVARSLVTILTYLDRLPEAREWLARARRIAHRTHLTRTVAGLRLSEARAIVELNSGNARTAARVAETLARRYTELGSVSRAAITWYNAGASRMEHGDLAGARRDYSEAMRLSRRWGLLGIEGSSHVALGQCALTDGDLREAEQLFRKALPLLRQAPHSEAYEVIARAGLSRVLTGRGELGEADEQLRIAEPMSHRTFAWTRHVVEQARALWLESSGDRAGARRLLARSLARTSRSSLRFMRLELLAARAQLERSAGRPSIAEGWEQQVRAEAAATGRMGRVPRLLRSVRAAPELRTDSGRPLPAPKRKGLLRPSIEPLGGFGHLVLRTLAQQRAVSGGPLDTDIVPITATQAGLASQLGIPRESFVRSLLRLVDRGAVVQTIRRVEGARRAQKVYFLTPRGMEMVRGGPGQSP